MLSEGVQHIATSLLQGEWAGASPSRNGGVKRDAEQRSATYHRTGVNGGWARLWTHLVLAARPAANRVHRLRRHGAQEAAGGGGDEFLGDPPQQIDLSLGGAPSKRALRRAHEAVHRGAGVRVRSGRELESARGAQRRLQVAAGGNADQFDHAHERAELPAAARAPQLSSGSSLQ